VGVSTRVEDNPSAIEPMLVQQIHQFSFHIALNAMNFKSVLHAQGRKLRIQIL
jgi:hypothetical protein